MDKTADAFTRFVEVIAKLRDPKTGCPWDLQQTHESLKPYLLEESYEALEAIDYGDASELCKELGDVLLQVVLHAQIAREQGDFSIADVCQAVADKMIRRHPHVFSDVKVEGAADVVKNWEQIKKEEQGVAPEEFHSVLDGIANSLPALLRAERLGERAAHVGFDWSNAADVWEKLEEELSELKTELDQVNSEAKPSGALRDRIQHELGDVLFSVCQLARKLGISAEDSLRIGADRFTERFNRIEREATRPLSDHSLDELEKLWQGTKQS